MTIKRADNDKIETTAKSDTNLSQRDREIDKCQKSDVNGNADRNTTEPSSLSVVRNLKNGNSPPEQNTTHTHTHQNPLMDKQHLHRDNKHQKQTLEQKMSDKQAPMGVEPIQFWELKAHHKTSMTSDDSRI